MTGPIAQLGAQTLGVVGGFGRIARFGGDIVVALFRPPIRLQRTLNELYDVGFLSLALIAASGVTVGAVLGLQGYTTLVRFGAEQSLGALVGLSLIRELGPVLTGLLVTGRAGSAMAAEIGAMVATEQLDGLRMMGVSPTHFVVLPKALAMMLAMPLLAAIFVVCAVYGGYLVGSILLGVDGGTYFSSLEAAINFEDDVVGSLLKTWIFGLLVGLVATYRGYTCDPTAAGVSRATTSTVVVASVCILIADYLVTSLWGI